MILTCFFSFDRDWAGKDVALLGGGSSAIQILPHLQRTSNVVHHFVRGRTFISEPFGGAFTLDALSHTDEPGNYTYQPEELQEFKDDPEHYWKYRKEMERYINLDFSTLFPGTESQISSTERIVKNMKEKLQTRPDIFDALLPSFIPGCRRLTPGPGYLEALVQPNVNFISKPITRVSENVSLYEIIAPVWRGL